MRIAMVLVVLLGVAVGGDSEDLEWSEVYEGYLPELEDEVVTVLVTDAVTGKPIEGARVNRHPENYPTASGWAPFDDGATTDRFGLASIRVGKETYTCHWAVHARGYAPTEEYGEGQDFEVSLHPGRDGCGRIVDVFGVPVKDLFVEYKLGCAHAPALRTAVTDASGLFTLRGIDLEGDLHFCGPTVRSQYGRASILRPPGTTPPTIVALPGTMLTGRMIGADPRDLLGAIIWSHTSMRGPLAGIASDGHFVLPGVDVAAKIEVMLAGDAIPAEIDPREHAPGRPILVQVDPEDDSENRVRVTVEIKTEAGSAVPEGVEIHLDSRRDGRRTTVLTTENTPAILDVVPGSYELSAGGPFDRYVAAPRSIEVGGAPVPIPLVLQEQARLELSGVSPPESWPPQTLAVMHLCLPTQSRRIQHAKLSELKSLDGIWLPANLPAALHLRMEGLTRAAPVGSIEKGIRRVVIPWPAFEPPEVPKTGPVGELRIVLPDGLLPGNTSAWIVLPGENGQGRVELPTWADADEQGVIRDPALVPGATVHLHFFSGAKQEMLLQGPGPWTFRPPGSAVLDIRIRGADEENVWPELLIDGVMWSREEDGHFRIPMLTAGPHLLIAGGEEHLCQAMQVILTEGKTRSIDLQLERRE